MHAYLPNDIHAVLLVLIGLGLLTGLGPVLFSIKQHQLSRILSWSVAVIMTSLAHWLTFDEPAGYRMLAIIALLFVSMKVVVANEFSLIGKKLAFWQWVAFALGWFGMNPAVFMRRQPQKKAQGKPLILFGLSRVTLGLLVCIIAWWIYRMYGMTGWFVTGAISLLLLIGISLVLHFGILNINSGLWNLLGVGAYPLFKSPLRSHSLDEFWGRRWNVAFSEMTSIAVYRPLRKITGERTARISAFAYSGLLHELAISLPVNAGFGLPSLYFILQAIALYLETRILFRSRITRHVWVMAWLVLPMPILFHRPFLEGVVWPLIISDR